ncbi:amino acid adenylation [Aliiglaciecola sp. CAU 1673]|uniref:amino acid adenylation n=1 Tax=Aliiglaciecola sp. CAU 1673 TaxID=3032595 RepID=UPI0023DAEF41|nr:amino acid adenylation [Aliiglaciecola sp. CAU 1673]MDF2176872.1 amino acid adenylation [Aliiglaciecola sp. CAU 1673]
MKLLFSATNALNKWLRADLPRLPAEQGKQAGVNSLSSDANIFSWQVHIIDNRYRSFEKTIVACEANSRFTFFLPVQEPLSLQELTPILQMQWQAVMAETLEEFRLLPTSEIALLLSDLSDIQLEAEWVRNTDLSINAHISDAGYWVTDTLSDRKLSRVTPDLALELAIFLNTQIRRQKQRKEQFIPLQRLFEYCVALIADNHSEQGVGGENVINLRDYRGR